MDFIEDMSAKYGMLSAAVSKYISDLSIMATKLEADDSGEDTSSFPSPKTSQRRNVLRKDKEACVEASNNPTQFIEDNHNDIMKIMR